MKLLAFLLLACLPVCSKAQNKTLSDTIPSKTEDSLFAADMHEVIVQSNRTSRTIANIPTRIETIDAEEIDEKSNMRPSNVSMILHESTGIAVQQTSATSGNASLRMQGLDGKYTQLLKDGFANFGNFSSSRNRFPGFSPRRFHSWSRSYNRRASAGLALKALS